MKKIARSAIFATLALAGCQDYNDPLRIASITSTIDFNSNSAAHSDEMEFLRRHPSLAVRENEKLTLRFKNSRALALQDATLERCENEADERVKLGGSGDFGSCVTYYRVFAYWPEKHWFFVDVLFYEGSETRIYNEGGQFERLSSRPFLSADRRSLFSYYPGCGMDAVAIELLDVSGIEPKVLQTGGFFAEPGGSPGQIFEISWQNSAKIVVTAGRCEDNSPTSSLSLERQESGAWVWSGRAPYTNSGVRTP